MKEKWRKPLIVLLVLTGIGIIVYPRYQVYQMEQEQEAMMRDWQQALAYIDTPPSEDELDEEAGEAVIDIIGTNGTSEDYSDNTVANTDDITTQAKDEAVVVTDVSEERKTLTVQDGMEGIITISSIDLQLPILKGITKGNLNRALAAMDNGFEPGSGMNLVIAGHRSHQEGQLFNRLDEVELEDSIYIDFGSTQESFVVTEKLYVKPDEVSVLVNQYEDDELTLITCHPMIHPTHRLIVKARLE